MAVFLPSAKEVQPDTGAAETAAIIESVLFSSITVWFISAVDPNVVINKEIKL